MKCKSIFIFLLAAVFAMGVCSPALAQKTTDKKDSEQKTAATAEKSSADQTKPAKKKVEPVKNADYWFDKGALCATYGNDPAAIKYLQKAISLDPRRSDAYFAQGVSYGQLQNFFKAIALIDKAIEMSPHNGLYYYGRARVYLLADEKEKAMEDFKKAAELDDEDAQNYINTIAKTQ